jgi:hypothetical protein
MKQDGVARITQYDIFCMVGIAQSRKMVFFYYKTERRLWAFVLRLDNTECLTYNRTLKKFHILIVMNLLQWIKIQFTYTIPVPFSCSVKKY